VLCSRNNAASPGGASKRIWLKWRTSAVQATARYRAYSISSVSGAVPEPQCLSMNKVTILIFTVLVVGCSSTHEEVRGWIGPLSPGELERAKARLSLVGAEMPANRVLETLRLSRFRECATRCEGPTTLALPFDLEGDHTLDLYYERASTNSSAWKLY
jgi:hypothetical protein